MVGAIEEVCKVLNRADVRYIVVGGVAVVLHGHLRTTADLDLVIQLEQPNILAALSALKSIGYRSKIPEPMEAFADAERRESWIRDKGMIVFSLWHPNRPTLAIDIFVKEPFNFDQAYTRSIRVDLDSTTATIVSLEDLIALKTEANRPQDRLDIIALRSLDDMED